MSQNTLNQLTLDFALKVWLLDCEARKLSPKTITTYEEQLKWFFEFARGDGIDRLADVQPHNLKAA